MDKVQRDAIAAVSEYSSEEAELYRDSYLGMIDVATAREAKGSPPSVIGDLVAKVLTTPRPRSHYVVGKDARLLASLTRFTPTLMFDAMRRKLFPSAGVRIARRPTRTRRSRPMKLANEDQVLALDAEFGRMAAEIGMHAWSLPQLTMREKAFVFVAADLCTANVGFPLLTHVQMAGASGVSLPECVAAVRHLAPYAGYPTAAVGLQQLRQLDRSEEPQPQPVYGSDMAAKNCRRPGRTGRGVRGVRREAVQPAVG